MNADVIAKKETDTKFEMVDGRMFDPLRPDPEKMDPGVISRVLSNSCRFGGHIRQFYSTAQHSVLVAYLSPRDLPAQKYALLHDADEAFGLPDMLTMLKPVFPSFVRAQSRIGRAIEKRYELRHEDHRRIKPADREALMIEKDHLKSKGNKAFWKLWSAARDAPSPIHLDPLMPDQANSLFLSAYHRVFEMERAIDDVWLQEQQGFRIPRPPAAAITAREPAGQITENTLGF